MSEQKNEQESAFPGTDARGFVSTGMTLRDWFAGEALMGKIAFDGTNAPEHIKKVVAKDLYEWADAMLEARKCI